MLSKLFGDKYYYQLYNDESVSLNLNQISKQDFLLLWRSMNGDLDLSEEKINEILKDTLKSVEFSIGERLTKGKECESRREADYYFPNKTEFSLMRKNPCLTIKYQAIDVFDKKSREYVKTIYSDWHKL